MLVWTMQPADALAQIERSGVFRCDPARSFNLTKPDSLAGPYRWLTERMRERIGAPPEGVVSPVWAWHTWDFERRSPEPESPAFLRRTEEKVLLTLDVPDAALEALDADALDAAIRASWENVFLTDRVACGEIVRGRYVQATFWEIRQEYIRAARRLAPHAEG